MSKRIVVGKIISGYSGDPDTRTSKTVQVTGSFDQLPIGTEVYADVKDREVVTLSAEEYDRLFEASQMLDALDACGVDNWEGYERAQEMVEEWDAENQ